MADAIHQILPYLGVILRRAELIEIFSGDIFIVMDIMVAAEVTVGKKQLPVSFSREDVFCGVVDGVRQ